MNLDRRQQEIHEAIAAADDALYALERAQKSLSGAGNWGLLDMFGGGMIVTMLKRGKMNQAQQEMEEARNALRRFSGELADIGRTLDLNLDTGDFLSFADYFFDGFVADWMAQSKIRDAQRQVQQAIRQVNSLRDRLWRMLG